MCVAAISRDFSTSCSHFFSTFKIMHILKAYSALQVLPNYINNTTIPILQKKRYKIYNLKILNEQNLKSKTIKLVSKIIILRIGELSVLTDKTVSSWHRAGASSYSNNKSFLPLIEWFTKPGEPVSKKVTASTRWVLVALSRQIISALSLKKLNLEVRKK